MNTKQFLLPSVALVCAAMLLVPAEQASAFSKIGGSLGVGQRDLRTFNNFGDAGANNNVRGFPDFPGWLGLEQAIWKGAADWNSVPRSSSGDTSQTQIGNGLANFDVFWIGAANGIGNSNNNIASAISSCGGGTLAFTETPISDGWRIRFCDEWNWADGPAGIGGGVFDLQGIMTHEYGHALGLGHSGVGNATMWPSGGAGQTSLRSIEADDRAGLQCVYGANSGARPTITSVSYSGGNITIDGTAFDIGTTNEVWFTNDNVSATNSDARVRVLGVASSGGGTQITIPIPANAGMGDVVVKNSGGMHTDLSNTYPSTLDRPLFGDATLYNGSGTNPICLSALTNPQLGQPFNLQIDASGHPGGAGLSGVLIYASPHQIPTIHGELLVDLGSPQYGFLIGSSGGGLDVHSLTPPADPAFFGNTATAQGFTFSVSSTVLCNALNLTLGAAN